jgi:diguanylate cyclase (GGDEF)-like protein
VILPQTDISGAELAAERMRAAIGRLRIPRVDGRGSLQVTASFGVATVRADASVRDGHEREKEALVAGADAALYRAKRAGKNRVERDLPSPAPR